MGSVVSTSGFSSFGGSGFGSSTLGDSGDWGDWGGFSGSGSEVFGCSSAGGGVSGTGGVSIGVSEGVVGISSVGFGSSVGAGCCGSEFSSAGFSSGFSSSFGSDGVGCNRFCRCHYDMDVEDNGILSFGWCNSHKHST